MFGGPGELPGAAEDFGELKRAPGAAGRRDERRTLLRSGVGGAFRRGVVPSPRYAAMSPRGPDACAIRMATSPSAHSGSVQASSSRTPSSRAATAVSVDGSSGAPTTR
jgi:hypothetical protein